MMSRKLLLCLTLLLAFTACNRDPKVVSKKYVDSGNKYFEKGKYKEAALMYRNALKKDGLNGEAYYRLGLTDLRMSRPGEASRALRRAVELQPANVDAAARLADIYLAAYLAQPQHPRELLEETQQIADRLLKRDPKLFEGLRLAGYLGLARQDLPKALEYFRQAHEVKPYQPDVSLAMMQTLSASNQFDEAEKLAKTAIEKNKEYPQLYDGLYMEYLRRNRQAEAEEILKLKIRNNPTSTESRVQLAGFYAATNRRQQMSETLDSVIENRKTLPNALSIVGDFYYRIGEFDQALKLYQQGAESEPAQKLTFQKRMIEVALRQGKREEASRIINEILAERPNEPDTVAIRAAMTLETGNQDQIREAIKDMESVVKSIPRNAILRFNLGRAYLATGQTDRARQQLEDAVKMAPTFLPGKLILAELYVRVRNYATARQLADEVLAVNANSTPARLIRSATLMASGDRERARTELLDTLKRQPQSVEAQFQLGVLNYQEGRLKDAETSFTHVRQQVPDNPRATLALAETYLSQGRPQQATELLTAEVSKHPEVRDLRIARANIAAVRGEYDTAIAEMSELVKQYPESADLYSRLGEYYRRKGDTASALQNLRRARELMPNNASTNLQLALMLEAAGRQSEAMPLYEQVIRIESDNPIALNNLAYIIAESGGDLDRALTYAQRARQRLPQNADVADTLALIYIKKNLNDNAIQILSGLVAKNPQRADYRYHYATALAQKGDKLSAKRELEAALRSSPNQQQESKIKELIAKLG